VFNEADISGLLTETLTANHKTVLADQTGLVSTDATLAAALAVGAWAAVPNRLVRHLVEFVFSCLELSSEEG